MELIGGHHYFTLNAGRQVGKTTCARWLVEHFNAGDTFRAIWVDIQNAREQPDPARAFSVVLEDLDRAVRRDLPAAVIPSGDAHALDPPESCLQRYLEALAQQLSLPLVVLFDEADGLVGAAMVSFLTQLRQGYIDREQRPFPASVVLIGQRPVRDYALREEDRRTVAWLGTTSPFNITTEATTLDAFSEEEVSELLAQHTEATGQPFAPAACARIYQLGRGHPWLTNALADQIVRKDVKDRSATIGAAHVDAAKDTLIVERRTHIDSLVARLKEARVQRILAPMLTGDSPKGNTLDDDLAYTASLGIIRIEDGYADIANPIYREVIPRALTYARQVTIYENPISYISADGSLALEKLMTAWQQFWREDGHRAAEGFGYQEAGPHLVLMAFLQRIINGGGRIEREYALGRGALDLLVTWRSTRHLIEVKLHRDTTTEARALQQIARYLDTAGLERGWLVLFDLRATVSWDDKLFIRTTEHQGKTIHIVGC